LDSSLTPACFALLDDCDASAAQPRSRLYTRHARTLACEGAEQLPALLDDMQRALRQGLHAVGMFSYELGAQLHGIAPRAGTDKVAQVLLFAHCERLDALQVDRWLTERADVQPAGIAQVVASVDEPAFQAALARIHDYIEAGDTYQINYTCRLRFDAYGSPLGLYRRLRARQPVPYGALIAMPGGEAILSLSPELFVRHEQGLLTARPMKGTAAAAADADENAARAAALAADPKNRAENLMIVDLLRNDLGRVARFGTVSVPQLFRVDRYGSVLQMTSTVQAQLREDATLSELFHALYPCGSITGAPKRRTMQIIRELEDAPRGIYTGAIGWFDAPQAAVQVGDFCLSVPIRTLALQAPRADGMRKGELGVGAGIVHDSEAADEYAECRLKARFLTGLQSDFELFETMHAAKEEGCRHLDLHLQRLHASAAYFNFQYDDAVLRGELARACNALPGGVSHRLRLALRPDGGCTVQTAPLLPLQLPVRVMIAPHPAGVDPLFLRHKSTVRADYDRAWREAESRGGFDMLFFNAEGELTEGGRSNVFIRLDDRWYTPPLSCSLLPGVMRGVLLADPAWQASERRLSHEDLRRAEQVVVCNALRGALPATLAWS
jgi:para-aminobenzoate synthetase / 4-amino-4-deoxychorismate lyase